MAPRKASKGATKGSAAKKNTKATKKIGEIEAKKKTDFFDLGDEGVRFCWRKILTIALVQKKPLLVSDVAWARSRYQHGVPNAHPGM
jgi:hypothetical protein